MCRVFYVVEGSGCLGTVCILQRQRKPGLCVGERDRNVDAPIRRFFRERLLPDVIAVAANLSAHHQTAEIGGGLRRDAPSVTYALDHVGLRAFDFALVHPGEAVAVGHWVRTVHLKPSRADPRYGADL